MAEKNLIFTQQLKSALKANGVRFEEGKRGNLMDFVKKHELVYSTINKAVTKPGHVPTWDILLKLSDIFGHSVEWFLRGEEDIAEGNNNVVLLPRKHPDLYEMLDQIDRSDDPKVIEAARSRLQGVLVMERDEVRLLLERMDRLEAKLVEKFDELIKLETPPTKRTRKPAPGRG
jgi:hypothetical protein